MLRDGIIATAQAIGADPLDLATVISYETAGTFDPTKAGPTTQWGQHRGLIQFGEPQAQQYGVDWNDPVGSQLGPNGAVARYLTSSGYKPGMGLLDLYSTINAGAPGRYTASDANNGGAPGTVADKVLTQMGAHREKARRLLGEAGSDSLMGNAGDDTLGGNMATSQPSALAGLLSRLTNREAPAPLSPMGAQERKSSIWDRLQGKPIIGGLADEDRRARMAIALQGMTIDPNEAFMSSLQSGIDDRSDDAKLQRTVEWLAQQPGGADYAAAISAGMSPQEAIGGFMEARQGPDAAEQIALARAGIGLEADQLRLAELHNGGGDPGVRASQILPDGTVIQSTDNGPRVFTPGGELLTGEAAAEAVRAAQEYGTEQQRSVYAARQEGTLGAQIDMGGAAESAKRGGQIAAEEGLAAYQAAVGIQRGISTIDEALVALDNGAQSGMVYNMLPNITEQSASLSNAMDRMGLDVISATTFGALSEGELRLAMETAVPRNLEPEALRNWLTKRKAAQQKAAAMLEDAALFLSTPGNTLGGWISKNRTARDSQPASQPAPQAAPQAAPAQPQQAPQPAPQPEQPAAPQAMPTPAQIAGMTAQDAANFFNGIQDLSTVPDAILEALIERANK